ncbi:MAG: putative quinol monooxygenase [Desulfomonilaceae bacterium]|nr:putative quinol monooxygenase [Desulfomonilaceae bacterium]
MADKKITVIANFRAKPGMEDKVREAVMNLVGPTRNEAGCINYDLHVSLQDKGRLMLYENWIGKKALDEHLEMPYLKDFLVKSGDILAEPVEIVLWEMVSEPAKP